MSEQANICFVIYILITMNELSKLEIVREVTWSIIDTVEDWEMNLDYYVLVIIINFTFFLLIQLLTIQNWGTFRTVLGNTE